MRRFLIATALLLTACGDHGSEATLNYYFTYDPRSLDPALSTDVPTGEVVSLLFDNLTQFDADAQLIPGLARTWETDAAGRGYTFHLRQDATFHDGRPIKAADVRASMLRALAPGSTGGRSWPLYPIRGARAYAAGQAKDVEGIAVPDDSTVVLTLEEPLNVFPKLLAMPVAAIVPTPTPPDFDQHPNGSGPWKFVSWSHDDAIVLAKNEQLLGRGPQVRHPPDPDHSRAADSGRRIRGRPAERGRGAGRRDPPLGAEPRRASSSAVRPCATCTSPSTPRAGRSRTSGSGGP